MAFAFGGQRDVAAAGISPGYRPFRLSWARGSADGILRIELGEELVSRPDKYMKRIDCLTMPHQEDTRGAGIFIFGRHIEIIQRLIYWQWGNGMSWTKG